MPDVCRGSWKWGSACGKCRRCMDGLVGRILECGRIQDQIDDALPEFGPMVMDELMKDRSLREIGRKTELSPTYLSRVKNGVVVISPGAYLKLMQLLNYSPEDV